MLQSLRATLDRQEICPKCGASWVEIENSLNEGVNSENFWTALHIIRNCEVCLIRFSTRIKRLQNGE